ncbi:MAG: beta-ketoacyl synthase N-terminal-like domain-containing protein [Steroidobacteraceae bacterium]
MLPLAITAFSVVCATGYGHRDLLAALQTRRGALTPNDFTADPADHLDRPVPDLESKVRDLPADLAPWDCRNNRLAWAGLNTDEFALAVADARHRYGARRIGLVMGTSTAAIDATEAFYRHQVDPPGTPPHLFQPELHSPHSLGDFVQRALDLEGPCFTIATACSSSAKVFCQAERLMRLGLLRCGGGGGCVIRYATVCCMDLAHWNCCRRRSAVPSRWIAVD